MLVLYACAWAFLSTMRPKKYIKFSDYWNGILWNVFKPSNAKGFQLVSNMKDLVRGTIYGKLENVIQAYIFFKETPDVQIIDIKEKMFLLGNITVNFVYKERFIGEMQFQYKEQDSEEKKKYYANHFIYELERAQEKIEMLSTLNK